MKYDKDRNWFSRIRAFTRRNIKCLIFILSTVTVACATMSTRKAADSHLRNEKLPVILEGYPGNILDGQMCCDPDREMDLSFARVIKWKLFSSRSDFLRPACVISGDPHGAPAS